MKRTQAFKLAVLVASGGVLFQVSSCAAVIAQILGQQIFASVLRAVLDAIFPETSTATNGTTP